MLILADLQVLVLHSQGRGGDSPLKTSSTLGQAAHSPKELSSAPGRVAIFQGASSPPQGKTSISVQIRAFTGSGREVRRKNLCIPLGNGPWQGQSP